MADAVNRFGQRTDGPWEAARRLFPNAAVLIVGDEGAEVLLVNPKADCSDYAIDGKTYTLEEAAAALEGFVLFDFQGRVRKPWATES